MRKLDRGELRNHLIKVFQGQVRPFLNSEGRELVETIRINPRKQDVSKGFDLGAERIIIDYFNKAVDYPVRILSEERGEIFTRNGKPRITLYMDPVDGSTNYRRGIESTAVSLAVIPEGLEICPANVEVALVGSVWSGHIFHAIKGEGAYYDGKKAESSKVQGIESALIGIDMDFNKGEKWKWGMVAPVILKCGMIRRGGSAALDSAYVATGAYDSILDVRDKSTAENFMASSLIIKEAGGMFTDDKGREIGNTQDLSKIFRWVASGNSVLHENVLKLLENGERVARVIRFLTFNRV